MYASAKKQLSRIAKRSPSFGKPVVNGVFDGATERSVALSEAVRPDRR